jgi:hypothetical protein
LPQVAPPPPHVATPLPQVAPPPPYVATPPPQVAPPPPYVATPPPHAAPQPYVATPPGAFAQPQVYTPMPAPSLPEPPGSFDIPDFTDEIDPQPAPAVWKQGHPSARKWAERRQGSQVVSAKRAPSLPRIVLGILIAALGAWLVLSFLPDRKPLTAAERARVEKQAGIDSDAWRFSQVGYMAARGGAALYLTIGILVALRGLVYRRRIETACRRCGRTVLAERTGLSLRCDSGAHSAGVNASALALVIAFSVLSVALVGLIAASSLGIV